MPQPPKFTPARTNARVGPVSLPYAGRAGDPPPWPMGQRPREAVADLWADLWRSPQACEWERLGWTRVVARYALVLLAAEDLDKDAMAEARQLEDRLGLTPKAMRLLLWTIGDPPADSASSPATPPEDEVARRRRVKATDLSLATEA